MTTTDCITFDDATSPSCFESFLFELSDQVKHVPADEIDAIVEEKLRMICEHFDLDRATLWQTGESHDMLELTHIYQPFHGSPLREAPETQFLSNPEWVRKICGTPPVYPRMKAGAFFPWTFRQIKHGLTVVIPMLDTLPPEAALDREMLVRYGTRSTVVVPLNLSPGRLGCLTFASMRAERYWSPLMVQRLELVAQLVARALARKSSAWMQRESEARMKTILNTAAEGIITLSVEGLIESVNLSAERLFGYGNGELIGCNIALLVPESHQQKHEHCLAEHVCTDKSVVSGARRQVVGRRKDGSCFPAELAISEIKLENRRLLSAFFCDISARIEAEKTRRESEQRFHTIADSAPVLIWMTDPHKSWSFFNQSWLAFTGRSMDEEIGSGWLAGIHPDDREAFKDAFNAAFDAQRPFVLQCQLRRKDGEYRWLVVSGVPRIDPQQQFHGYIGSCTDITEQKLVEKAAQDLSGRLIKAQEDERARLARELHDDITQRLASLAIDVGHFEQTAALKGSQGELIRGVRQRLVRLSQDVHSLSYELHPSALIDLGLEEALQSECEQFSCRESVVAEVRLRELPKAISREIAIGLFRIVQEGLRNAVRHGRASKIEVSLRGIDSGLQLAVRDNGCGFDPNRCRPGPSLGLASMRERIRLLNGGLDIESELGYGTTIVAWVPLAEKPK